MGTGGASSQLSPTGGAGSASDDNKRRRTGEPSSPNQEKEEAKFRPKRRNKKQNPKVKVNDAGMQRLLASLLRATLMNTQALREIKGAMYDVTILSKDHKLVEAMKREGAAYAKAVREEGAGHERGPPSLTVGLGFLETLAQLEVGAVNRQGIERFLENNQDKTVLLHHLRVCRLEKCHDEEKIKIMTCFSDELRLLTISALRQLADVKTCQGKPPAGYVEEELAAFLEQMKL